jgi:hypothetical protein
MKGNKSYIFKIINIFVEGSNVNFQVFLGILEAFLHFDIDDFLNSLAFPYHALHLPETMALIY